MKGIVFIIFILISIQVFSQKRGILINSRTGNGMITTQGKVAGYNISTPGTSEIKTFLIRIGGGTLASGSQDSIAKFDNVILQRFNYDDIGGDTYSAIKSINPNIKIYIYQYGSWSVSTDDLPLDVSFMRSIGRQVDSRGHSSGDLNIDNPSYFLLTSGSQKIVLNSFLNDYLMDFGNTGFVDYWTEATTTDIVGSAWEADGIFMDVVVPLRSTLLASLSGTPLKYTSDKAWTNSTNQFISQVTSNFTSTNLIGVNYGSSRVDSGRVAWNALDDLTVHPNFAMEEGAFVTWYGAADAYFFTKAQWLSQLNTLNDVRNVKTFFHSMTKLARDATGTSNYGNSVNFWDALWFGMTSFKLGQHDNSYFGFAYNNSYLNLSYFDEFDIKTGEAIGTYQIVDMSGTEIFMREFERAYVFVNPNNTTVSNIVLPTVGRQLSHSNFQSTISLPIINSIDLLPHTGTIILK